MKGRLKTKGMGGLVAVLIVAVILIVAVAAVAVLKPDIFDFSGGGEGSDSDNVPVTPDTGLAEEPVLGEAAPEGDNLGAELFEGTGGQVQGENLTPSVAAPVVNPLEGVYENPFE